MDFFVFRIIARIVVPVCVVSISTVVCMAHAQQSIPNPIAAPNPLTTLSIFAAILEGKVMSRQALLSHMNSSGSANGQREPA
jgi:hypothetical protein